MIYMETWIGRQVNLTTPTSIVRTKKRQMRFQDKQHFSHHHILISLQLDEGEEIKCKGCDQIIVEPFHGCLSCNFYLHNHCMNAPRSLQHPSHPSHPLSLLPFPTYCCRSYTCDACGSEGRAFGFSCSHCEFDLHVKCATLPSTILLENHRHELKLVFGSPYEDKSTVFACDLCRGIMQNNFWLYYCEDCDFAGHLDCATSKGCSKEEESRKPADDDAAAKERSNVNQVDFENQTQESEMSIFEAQRKLREQHIAHKIMLEALDNAGDYVGSGSSYTRTYYY